MRDDVDRSTDMSTGARRSDGRDRRTISRRSLIGASITGLAAAATPVGAASISSDAVEDTLTAAALEAASDPRRRADGLKELHESSGLPTWIVEYDEDDGLESLKEWSDGDEERLILDAYTHEESRTAVVRASTSDVGAALLSRILDQGLASRSYIETIDANPILELTEPVSLGSESEIWPEFGRLDTVLRYGGDPPVADGLAFDEVPPATMSEVRELVNASAIETEEPTIAVVDTGLNTSGGSLFDDGTADGETLAGGADGTRVLEASKNMISGTTVATDGLGAIEDRNGHGTFVASQIGGDPPGSDHTGILPSARLLAIKALGDDGAGSTADIARAIRYAADEGVDAIVLSLGSPAYSHELDRAIEYAAGSGSITVAATGNDRLGTRWVSSPSSSTRAIAVASTTAGSGSEPIRSSYYSNVGPHPGTTDLSGGETSGASVDVAAPGHEIETTVATRGGDLETETLSGTSMAAPIVGAVVATLSSSDPETVRETLRDAAEPVEDAAEAEVGAGLVDAERTASGGESAESQSEVMTDDATARDDAYRTESDSRGRFVLGWF